MAEQMNQIDMKKIDKIIQKYNLQDSQLLNVKKGRNGKNIFKDNKTNICNNTFTLSNYHFCSQLFNSNLIKVPYDENSNKPNPFNAIGYIYAKFYDTQQSSRQTFGTGALIQKNIVLTCAHNLFNMNQNIFASQISFYPGNKHKFGPYQFPIISYQVYIPKQYKNSTLSQNLRRNYDYAFIYISGQDFSQNHGYFGLLPQYQIDNFDQKMCFTNQIKRHLKLQENVFIFGYFPSQKAPFYHSDIKGNILKKKNIKIKNNRLFYQSQTISGFSGSPIFVIGQDGTYKIIGIHTRKQGEIKSGLKSGLKINNQMIQRLLQWIKPLRKKSLNVGQEKLTSQQLYYLKNVFNNFNFISQLHIGYYGQDNEQIGDYWIQKMQEEKNLVFSNLQFLSLEKTNLSNQGFKKLLWIGGSFKNLKELDLQENKISSFNIQAISQDSNIFPNLQSLNFGRNFLRQKGVFSLVSGKNLFKNLKRLYLNKNQIQDNGMSFLMINKNMHIIFTNLCELVLDKNLISGKGLKYAYKETYKNLTKISLNSNIISDNSVVQEIIYDKQLFPKLKQIEIKQNKLSKLTEFMANKVQDYRKLHKKSLASKQYF